MTSRTELSPWSLDVERLWRAAFALVFVPALLIVSYRYNPVLAHSIAEVFSVIVDCGIFMMTWNARRFIDNGYLVVLGAAYLFVGVIDSAHATSFSGVFGPAHQAISIELWFAARFVQCTALLVAPLFVHRKAPAVLLFWAFAALSALFVVAVYSGWVPAFYEPGVGMKAVKTASDHLVVALLGLAAWALWKARESFDRSVFRQLTLSILLALFSELSADVYTDKFLYNSIVGHYLKVLSSYLVYRAVIENGLLRPYQLMFRNLKQSEEKLRAARDGLESYAEDRTVELRAANERLERELSARRRELELRQLLLDLVHCTDAARSVAEYIELAVPFLRERLGFESVSVKLPSGHAYPFLESRGFAQMFVDAGPLLSQECVPDREAPECACAAAMALQHEPATAAERTPGIYWTNNAAVVPQHHKGLHVLPSSSRCLREGFVSLAIVPLRFGESTYGLLRLQDHREGLLDQVGLERIERVAGSLAAALAHLLAQDAHRESEDRFRTLLENSSVVSLIYQNRRLLYGNPAAELTFGVVTEGASFRELGQVHPDDRATFYQLCEELDLGLARSIDLVVRFLLQDFETGTLQVRWFKMQSSPIGVRGQPAILVELVDITRLKELEHTVAVRERLASLGQMAAGIAHEVRNPLSGINLNVSTLGLVCSGAEGLTPEEKAKVEALLAQIRAASQKTSAVIRRVMEFSKATPPKMERIDVSQAVGNALVLSGAPARKAGAELVPQLAKAPLFCQADAALLEQVVLNLINNALQALQHLDGPRRVVVALSQEGDRAVVRVSDNGPGVPSHLHDKIFEPFFTTKKEGHGIGLSFSHRIVADHGGRLTVGTAGLGGAEFRVELPLAPEGERSA